MALWCCKRRFRSGLCIVLILLILTCTLYWFLFEILLRYKGSVACPCRIIPHPLVDDTQWLLNDEDPWTGQPTGDGLISKHPNLPVHLWQDSRQRCHLLPYITDIAWSGNIWQEALGADNTKYLLYSAIYDNRSLSDHVDYQWRSYTRHMPFLVTCPIPSTISGLIPSAVALAASPCTHTTNIMRVIGPTPDEDEGVQYMENNGAGSGLKRNPKIGPTQRGGSSDGDREHTVGVCGPALYYYHNDFSLRLIEWLEFMKILGVSQVYLYNTGVHPNVTKVLDYYEREGFLHVLDFQYPPPYLNIPSLRRLWTLMERDRMFSLENVYFTDCVLRHMYQHRFIAHFDPDEIPILHHANTLPELLSTLSNRTHDGKIPTVGYGLYWNFFYDDIESGRTGENTPSFLHTLRHSKRVSNRPVNLGKSIYDTNQVVAVYSHNPMLCLTGTCTETEKIPEEVAYLGHFTKLCKDKCTSKDIIEEDVTLFKYEKNITLRVSNVAAFLQLL